MEGKLDDRITKYSRVYAAVNLDAICTNIHKMQLQLGEKTKIMAVIKTDGYGHGAVPVARVLEPMEAVMGFAVATAEEALILRECGIKKPILLLGYTFPDTYQEMIKHQIRLPLFRMDMAHQLSSCALALGEDYRAAVHIKVDTGMSRIGIQPNAEGLEFIRQVGKLPGLKIEGIFTHFARADEADKSQTLKQLECFKELIIQAETITGNRIPLHHCSNSAGLLELREADMDVVRAGIALYGLNPSQEVTGEAWGLIPAMELKSRIIYLKEIEPGTPVSYGSSFVAKQRMRIATISIGYGDGYPRGLSNKGYVLIHGKKAPILGRVCMDQFMVDTTSIPQAREGDWVTLIGRDGQEQITMEELGELSGRFHYELVCCIGKRVPRIYVKSGRVVGAGDWSQDYHYQDFDEILGGN